MSVAAGMAVMQAMFNAEVVAVCGPKSRHDADRTATRHGREKCSVVLGGRRVPVTRPRARTVEGQEVPLSTYRLFAGEDQLAAVVMERMLAGLATRRHTAAAEPVGADVEDAASATSRSAISRRFVAQTKTALAELLARDLSALGVKVLMIDGEHIADHCCVVALAITAIQRCTVHKRRNVAEHLPETERDWVDLKLVRALNNPDAAAGLRDANALATALERKHPGAAASLREGLPELFTMARLGIAGTLSKTLTSSNPIESMISIARTTTSRAASLPPSRPNKRHVSGAA